MESQQERIVSCIHLVRYLAKRLVQDSRRISREDAESEGYLALVKAAQSFQPDQGVAFSTFASFRVRGAIMDALRKADTRSRLLRQKLRTYERAWGDLALQLGREPRPAEIAAHLGLNPSELRGPNPVPDFGTGYLAPIRGAGAKVRDFAESAEDTALRWIQTEHVRGLIASLPPRERAIVVRRYFEGETMTRIARDFGISVGRACEIHRGALDRLRRMVEAREAVAAA